MAGGDIHPAIKEKLAEVTANIQAAADQTAAPEDKASGEEPNAKNLNDNYHGRN